MNMKLKSSKGLIDLADWQPQIKYANANNLNLSTVSKWVMRIKAGSKTQPIEILEIPELEMVLVRKKVIND
jgi:hypothetical protein